MKECSGGDRMGSCDHIWSSQLFLAGRSGSGIGIELVIREDYVQFGGAEQEAGSDRADVTGQPETIHFHEVLAKAGRPYQHGNAYCELALDPHRAKTLRIH